MAKRKAAEDGRAPTPRGWHARGYLPHCDVADHCQSITYRLADSLPSAVAQRLLTEPHTATGDAAYRERIEAFLDTGYGECLLRRQEVVEIVVDAWRHFDDVRYKLIAWVVMPNHVHALIGMKQTSLSEIIQGWKSFTAHRINRLVGRNGPLWQEDYWDRFIRDEAHFAAVMDYIQSNPVKAGLVQAAEDWPYSSARERGRPRPHT